MSSFLGKYLEVDLNDRSFSEQCVDEEIYRKFLGGLGFGANYLYKNHEKDTDPLGPRNILGFVPGLLNGVDFPLSGRMSVVAKSPLTNTWGDSNVGGYFGTELKKAGYDAVFIKGCAEKPIYLKIGEEKEFVDASELWGEDTKKTKKRIKEKEGNDFRVASIGPSGENESLISSIIFGEDRAAARSGVGAVMGSKNLKAVAVKRNQENKINIEDRNVFKEAKEETIRKLNKEPSKVINYLMKLVEPIMPWLLRKGFANSADEGTIIDLFKKHGTAMGTALSTEMGDGPCKNWKASGTEAFPYKEAQEITGENVTKYQTKDYACATCLIGCGGKVSNENGPYRVDDGRRPEYETLAAFGSMTLNNDVESIIKCNEICDRYGIDTISTGSTIAYTIECFEENLLSKEDLDGIEPSWGDEEAIVELTKMIAKRKGIGDILADGVKEASEEIGDKSKKYAMHVCGQEVPMHDPRLNPSFATAYVSDPTPARHTKGGSGHNEFGMNPNSFKEIEFNEKKNNKGEVHAKAVKVQVLLDSLGLCFFLGYFGDFPVLDALNAVNNWNLTKDEVLRIGERIQVIRHSYNVREGFRRDDFSLPDRIKGKPPLKTGPTKDVTLDVDKMVKDYYRAMEWNGEGKPSEEKLKELDLEEVAKDLY